MVKYHLQDLPVERADQRSFHIVSETHVRIEFVRLDADQALGPISYQGDVVVTCVEGAVGVLAEQLSALEQCVVVEGDELQVVGRAAASIIQIIWCPPFAGVSGASGSEGT